VPITFINLQNESIKFEPQACGLVLGHFDGMHLGHRALVEELKRQARAYDGALPLGAFCFSEPPSLYLNGGSVPQLTTLEEKLKLMREAGLQFAALGNFLEIRTMSPALFAQKILIGECHCRIAVCGFNYTFGYRGEGKAEDLVQMLGAYGACHTFVVPPVTDGPNTVCSTVIRSMLQNRRPEDAARLLGRPFSLTGKVEHGKKLGRALGLPTANLSFPPMGLVPAHGVYVTHVKIGRRTYLGVSNVGVRPTVDKTKVANCETFILDFNGDIYDREIKISFLKFLRPERAFTSLDELQAQIQKDIKAARDTALSSL